MEDDARYPAWHARSEAFDEAVGKAYADVTVPDGLAERLVAALQEAERTTAPSGDLATVAEPARLHRR